MIKKQNIDNKICKSDKKCSSIAENLGYLVEIFAEAFEIDLKELKKK